MSTASEFFDYYWSAATGIITDPSAIGGSVFGLKAGAAYATSAIATPDGGTLDQCTNIRAEMEFYYEVTGKWEKGGAVFFTSAFQGGWGMRSVVYKDNSTLFVRMGRGLFFDRKNCGGSVAGTTGNTTPRYSRYHIKAVKNV